MTIDQENLEEWRDVVDYEDFYKVSDFGRVRSLDRIVYRTSILRKSGKVNRVGKILRLREGNQFGHLSVTLCRKNVRQKKYVHILVLEAFVGPRPYGKICCHGEAGQQINHLSNLSWGSYSQNIEDRRRDGTLNTKRVRRSDGEEFEGLQLAASQSNSHAGVIGDVCSGRRKTAGGYGWEYIK